MVHFKVFIEVTIPLLFLILVFCPQDMWDLTDPTRDQMHTLCFARQSLNSWTAREIPKQSMLITSKGRFSNFVLISPLIPVIKSGQQTCVHCFLGTRIG